MSTLSKFMSGGLCHEVAHNGPVILINRPSQMQDGHSTGRNHRWSYKRFWLVV